MNKGLNMRSVKSENRSLILYLLNSNGSLSRKEIASQLDLTPAAVTKICSDLIEEGYIRECGETHKQGKSGRKEIMLSLCLDDKLVFGINAEKDIITLSVSSLSGKLIKQSQIAFSPDVNSVINSSKLFLNRSGFKNRIIAVGICIVGSQDEKDFGIWKDENLKGKFEEEFEEPVVIENNVKAFAESELIYGESKKSNSVLFLKWGPGIGSAIVANGKVFSGNDSSVAEIGHYIVNAGGVRCRCGRFGCLETEAGEDAIRTEIKSNLPLDEILKNCNNNIVNIIEHKIDMVALALTNTATILNTNNIVLFGTMFNNEMIAEKLKKQCIRYNSNLSENTLVLSSLNAKSAYIGAAAICAKHFFFESRQ